MYLESNRVINNLCVVWRVNLREKDKC